MWLAGHFSASLVAARHHESGKAVGQIGKLNLCVSGQHQMITCEIGLGHEALIQEQQQVPEGYLQGKEPPNVSSFLNF